VSNVDWGGMDGTEGRGEGGQKHQGVDFGASCSEGIHQKVVTGPWI
jgi:hypothetical protein